MAAATAAEAACTRMPTLLRVGATCKRRMCCPCTLCPPCRSCTLVHPTTGPVMGQTDRVVARGKGAQQCVANHALLMRAPLADEFMWLHSAHISR